MELEDAPGDYFEDWLKTLKFPLAKQDQLELLRITL